MTDYANKFLHEEEDDKKAAEAKQAEKPTNERKSSSAKSRKRKKMSSGSDTGPQKPLEVHDLVMAPWGKGQRKRMLPGRVIVLDDDEATVQWLKDGEFTTCTTMDACLVIPKRS